MKDEQYVPPFIRRLMKHASENDIRQAADNLRAYLEVLYRIHLEWQHPQQAHDSLDLPANDKILKLRPSSTMNRYYGYIRVSTVKQGEKGSSLQEQKASIEQFAQRQGFEVAQWFEERETAAKRGRTEFVRMMSYLERRKATGVILHKIDRGARNLWDWARIQDLIDAGIEVHFAHDNLDLKSRGGRLAADIQAVVAADYVRNLREEVRKGMRGRLKQGLYPLHAPVGYLDQGSGKAKVIDPVKGPLVKAAFSLYATKRYTYRSLSAELHRRGLRQTNGKPLSMSGLATILRNPFYIGILRLKTVEDAFEGVHDRLIDPRIFRLVQEIIDGKTNTAVRRFEFRYKRLLRCGLCAGVLTGESQKGRTYYRCHTKSCGTKGIREDAIDVQLLAATEAFRFTEEQIEQMAPYFSRRTQERVAEQAELLASLKLRISALEGRERRLTDAYIDLAIDRDAFALRKSEILLELAEVRHESARLGAAPDTERLNLQNFFEFVKTFELSPERISAADYRVAVEIVTSNLAVTGKTLSIAMRSPFQQLASDLSVFSGGLDRNTIRTPNRRMPKNVNIERAEILLKHLKDWEPPTWLTEKAKPVRKPHSRWFKPKEPPTTDLPPVA